MAALNGLLIYAKGRMTARRVILPDDDWEIADPALWVQPGEAFIVVPLAILQTTDAHSVLAAHFGMAEAPRARAAVVDSAGVVVAIIAADEDCGDQVAGHRLVSSPDAAIGHVYDGRDFKHPSLDEPAPPAVV